MADTGRLRTVAPTLAALILAIESIVCLAGVPALAAAASSNPDRGYGFAAAVDAIFGAAFLAAAVGVATGRSSSWCWAYALDAVAGLAGLSAMASQPAVGLLAAGLSATGVWMLILARPDVLRVRTDCIVSNSRKDAGAPATPSPVAVVGLTSGGVLIGLATVIVLVGALTVQIGLIFGLVVLAAIFIPLEKVFALHPQKILREGWKTDVVHFLVSNFLTNLGLVVPVVLVGVGLRAAVPGWVHRGISQEPALLQFLEAFVIAEFGSYVGHRAAHRVPLLWRFHKVHHSAKQMDWLVATHLHPVDQIWTRSCAILPLYALGFSRLSFGGFLVVATFQGIFIHANVRLTFGPLRWLIATPEFHHWHHANEPEAYNSNFAGEFPWIDAMFGTLHLPKGRMPAQYGIDEGQPEGYLAQLAWPFRRVASPV